MKNIKQELVWKLMSLYKELWDEEMLWDFVETELYMNNQTSDIKERIREFKELYNK